VKYLGVILDQTLSGVEHVQSILKKAGSRLAFLFRYSAILNQRARLTICSALVQPNFDYCCSTWFSSLTAAYKTKLAVIQRRMVRFVLGMNPRDHVGQQEFRKLSWLTIENRVDYFKTLHFFKIKKGPCPSYLKGVFTKISDAHNSGLVLRNLIISSLSSLRQE
jgi:hypothetical protein